MKNDFNPVKEERDGVRARRVVWSTKSLEAALKGLEEGKKLIANPFYENNSKILKGDLVFQRTKEEVEEWKKCANDIHYFSNTYCKLMTPEGIKKVTMRDYQTRYLDHLMKHRLSVFLAARQCGKCLIPNELPKFRFKNTFWQTVGKNKESYLTQYYKKDEDCYEIPFFELMNLYWSGPIWKLKYQIYKKIQNTNSEQLKNYLYKCIEILDLKNNKEHKLIESHILNGVLVKTDEGYVPAAMIHETKPFKVYELITEKAYKIQGADEHLVFDSNLHTVWLKDLKVKQEIITESGIDRVKKIKTYNRRLSMCDITVLNNKESYFVNGILSHNTTTSSIFLLWYILFNIDKNALVVADIFSHAKDIMDKTKAIFVELPYFLRPGVYKWNESQVVLDNGCKLIAQTTTPTSGVGYTLHCVLWDEVAATKESIKDKFFSYILPTIQAGHARLMLTSTAGGFDLFYRVYKAAEQHLSEFGAFKTDWDEIPEWNPDKKCWEKRDEAWHQQQIANYGSEEAFNSQFGTSFDVNANTLIDTKYLRKKQKEAIEFVNKDLPGVSNSQYFFWRPDYEPSEDLRKDFITVTIDIAEGGGGDYTIFNFNRMTAKGDKCVGFFKSNIISIEKATLSLMEIDTKYLHPNHHCISLEYNTYGELFVKDIRENRDKFPHVASFDESNFVKYYNEAMTSYRIGIKLTSSTKSIGCKLFKEQYEKGLIENVSASFLIELENFCDNKGNETYQASFGHDDEVMAQIQLVHAKQSNAYKNLRSEFDSYTPSNEQKKELAPGVSQEEVDKMNSGEYFDPTKVFGTFNSMDDIYNSIEQRTSMGDYNRLRQFS